MQEKTGCIILTGMPGAGKSTIGQELACALGYGFIDTDFLLESLYARRLQDVTNILGRDEFLDAECEVICALHASRCVVATGGSVIYRRKAMEHLKQLGRIVHLNLPLHKLKERISQNPERGISFGPGQSLDDLYAERIGLYAAYAEYECFTGESSPAECADEIIKLLGIN